MEDWVGFAVEKQPRALRADLSLGRSGARPGFGKAESARRHRGRAPMAGGRAQARGSSADGRRECAGPGTGVERRAADRDPRPAVISRTAGPAQVLLAQGGRGSADPVGRGDSGLGPQASPYHKGVPLSWGLLYRFLELAPRSPAVVGGNPRRVPPGAPANSPLR